MKKLIHVLATGAALFTATAADSTAQLAVSAGPKLGVNFANAHVDPGFDRFAADAEQSAIPGPIVGGALEVKMSDLVYVVFEAQYVRKGTSVANLEYFDHNHAELGAVSGIDFRYGYVEFPVLGKLKFGGDDLKGAMFAGVDVGLNTSAVGVYRHENGTRSHDFSDDISGIDIALDFGAGVEYRIAGGTTLTGDIRYSHGVYDIDDAVGPFGDESWSSRDIKLSAGLMVDIWQSTRR